MNKRSAMVVAAGLVAALMAGGTALSFSLAGGTAAAQDGGRVRPIVKTERRTVTIHKKAKAKPAEVVMVSAPSTSSTTDVSGSSAGDDGHETESDAYEDEQESEHEDDGFESPDRQSDPDESGGDD
jgi:hypothetical protein